MAEIVVEHNNDFNLRKQLSEVLTDHDDRIAADEAAITALQGAMTTAQADIITAQTTANYSASIIQPLVPSEGGSGLVVSADDRDVTVVLDGAGALTDYSLDFPDDADSRIGQFVRVASRFDITNLALATASAGTILNPIAAIVGDECYAFQKIGADLWIRVL